MDTQEQRIEQAANILAKHQGCDVSTILDTERVLIGQDVILPAMQEYADLRCKPLIEALELAHNYLNSYMSVYPQSGVHNTIKKALQDYKK